MEYYFECYGELSLQRLMVSDAPRTDAFAAAIKEVVKNKERVLDVGTGTGLLAMLAAKAGASKVYALDQAAIADAAKDTVERNQLSNIVEVVHGHAVDFALVEPVDVLVSEWLGHFAFAETMLDDVIACRDENLKEDGVMLPSNVELMLAPVDSTILYDDEGPGFWTQPVHGIDFSHLENVEIQQSFAVKTTIPSNDLLAAAKPMFALDLGTAKADDPWQSGHLEFTARRNGNLDGFAGWFNAQLSPSVMLDTAPDQPTTHWQQTYFPLPRTPIRSGQRIKVDFSLGKHPVEKRSLELKLRTDDHNFHFTIG